MRSAAGGHSTLGIPKSVGQDYSAADPGGKLPKVAPKEGLKAKLSRQKKGRK